MTRADRRLLDWTDDLRVGVPAIDAQHREIFRRLRDFREAHAEGRGAEEIEPVLTFLADYVIEHFADEERLMKERGYAARGRHRVEHRAFRAVLEGFVACYRSSGASTLLGLQIEHRCVDWLINHIRKTDQELAKFLKSKPPTDVAPASR